jgi:hypothetical protein
MRSLAAAFLAFAACTTYSSERSDVQHTNRVEVVLYGNAVGAPPLADEPVAFVDPDGTSQVVVTDSHGVARADVAPGASVTAVIDQLVPAGNPPQVKTVLDVRDGDHIALGYPPVDAIVPTGTGSCGPVTLSARYTNVDPSVISSLQLTRTTDTDINYTSAIGATPTVTASVQGAAAAHAYVDTELGSTAGHGQWVRELVDGCATSYQLDVGAGLLPWVDAPTVDFDRQVLHVPLDGPGTPDLVAAQATIQRGGTDIDWEIVSPRGGDLVFPPLPAGLEGYLPRPGDTQGGSAVWVIGADGLGGYAAAHQQADALVDVVDNRAELIGTRMRASWIIDL